MALKAEKAVLHAALEVTYALAITMLAAHAIRTKDVEIMPFEAEAIDRDLDQPSFGSNQKIHHGIHAKVKFKVELAGSGTLGTAPAWGVLMKGCQWLESVVASTSVEYTLNSAGTGSLTMNFNVDGLNHVLTGARGTVDIEFTSGGIPYLAFEFWGLYTPPSAVAALATTGWSGFMTPKPVSFTHTPGVEFFGITSGWVLKKFGFKQGNDVQYFNNPGEESVEIVDRECTGDIELLAPAFGVFNAFTNAAADTLGAMEIVHGTSLDRVILISPQIQLTQPKYGEDKKRLLISAGLSFVPTVANDDEFKIRLAAS